VTTALRLLLGLIFAFLVVGLMTHSSGVIVLTIPLIVYLAAAVALRPEAVSVTMTRTFTPDHAPQNAPITVKISLLNIGPTIDELAVQDILPGGATILDGEAATTVFMAENASLELEYTIAVRRGEYTDHETTLRARDALGVFEQTHGYRTTARLVVHPRYPKLERIRIRPPQTRGFAGPIAARQAGSGIDFWAVREYQANDPQGQINWRLSARSERDLFTNVFEQERVADVGLILDARERTNVHLGAEALFEHSVHAAAALAENFLNDGNRVSLLVYGPGITRVFPGYGRVQRNRILQELSRAETGINYALESLHHLPTSLFPAKSQLVVISPLLPEDIPTLVRMRAHGYAVLVVSPDPISFESSHAGDTASLAYRVAYAERSLMLRQMRQCGAQLVNWPIDQPLEIAIRETLASQPLAVHHLNRM